MNPYKVRQDAEAIYDRIAAQHALEKLDSRVSKCPDCGEWRFDGICRAGERYDLPHCGWCDRPMRDRDTPKASFPHAIMQGTKEFCISCYRKVLDRGNTAVYYIMNPTVMVGGEGALEKELDDAVQSYWENRKAFLSGPINGND